MESRSGNVTKENYDRVREIMGILEGLPEMTHVLFIATAGDPGYNKMHEGQFGLWLSEYVNSGVEGCIPMIGNSLLWYLGDFLHLAENAKIDWTEIFQ
jgi:hypothetical protein